jgi:uncharacterized protein with HEPN domain
MERDALNSAGRIRRFVEQFSFEDYAGDRMLRSTVEREFEMIGEASRQLAGAGRAADAGSLAC